MLTAEEISQGLDDLGELLFTKKFIKCVNINVNNNIRVFLLIFSCVRRKYHFDVLQLYNICDRPMYLDL